VFNDLETEITGPAKKVLRESLEYYKYLATSKYLVQNTNFPNSFVKRKNQIELSTLHGTFMKTMGYDEPHFKYATKLVRDAFDMRNGRWNYMISPSPFMTKTATNAFKFEREVLESGFPRNDVLYHRNYEADILEIKKKLKLPTDKKILFYAPTYRERSGFKLELDLYRMKEELSDNYIVLLRLHYFVAKNIDLTGLEDFVYDESFYPSIEELYLVSDALITDYSSVMFDYAHLRRPMYFFAYDEESYTGEARGIYMDYEETVPGPISKNTDSLISEILSYNETDYQDKMNRFYDTYCTFGRGGTASETVVKTVFK
jgi:CDP-glycerol glycerophosphotransferase